MDRTASGRGKKQTEIRPTESNAVVLGAEDGLIALFDAEELHIRQGSDLDAC